MNLTYKSPNEDIENCTGMNPDGSVNAKFTLLSMRELLTKNIAVVNKLLENVENITDIIPVGYGLVETKINSQTILKNLIENGTLIKPPEYTDMNEFQIDDLEFSDGEETNQDRLNMVNNLVNQQDTQSDFGRNLDSDSDSDTESDDLIDDKKNTQSILDKYNRIINDAINSDDDTNDFSDYDSDNLDDK